MYADGVGGEIADGNVTIGFLHQRIGEVDADPCTVDIYAGKYAGKTV